MLTYNDLTSVANIYHWFKFQSGSETLDSITGATDIISLRNTTTYPITKYSFAPSFPEASNAVLLDSAGGGIDIDITKVNSDSIGVTFLVDKKITGSYNPIIGIDYLSNNGSLQNREYRASQLFDSSNLDSLNGDIPYDTITIEIRDLVKKSGVINTRELDDPAGDKFSNSNPLLPYREYRSWTLFLDDDSGDGPFNLDIHFKASILGYNVDAHKALSHVASNNANGFDLYYQILIIGVDEKGSTYTIDVIRNPFDKTVSYSVPYKKVIIAYYDVNSTGSGEIDGLDFEARLYNPSSGYDGVEMRR